MTDKHGLFD